MESIAQTGTVNGPDRHEPLQSFSVGADRVAFYRELLIIDAAREMPDWKLREFARKPIYFREKKYALRSKSAAEKPYALRYVLEPWPEDFAEVPRAFFLYDEAAVAHRDAAHRSERAGTFAHKVLLPFYPFLGFLWSGTKDKLSGIGFEPRSITSASILATFLFLLLEGVFTVILLFTSALGKRLMLGGLLRLLWGGSEISVFGLTLPIVLVEVVVAAVLIVDLLMRYGQHLKNTDETPWGFLEWVKRSRR